MNTIGHNIKITFFGESHGPFIGVVIDNLPSGLCLDEELIRFNLSKRRPAKKISTTRVEMDEYQIISGFLDGKTTGGALTVLVENSNTISQDYKNLNITPRPSHSDYPASVKYNGFNDYRGGGFFSGRLTALWVIVGSIAQQILQKQNIYIGSHIYSLKDIKDQPFDTMSHDVEQIQEVNKHFFALLDKSKEKEMYDLIRTAKMDLNSVGGIVESKIVNMPVGIGEPYFLSFESYVSQLLFSVPALKAVEFGTGFDITKSFGSEMNDQYEIKDGKISTLSNNNGGILGGLTNGMPIIVRSAIKPTSSIAKTQQTVNLETMQNTDLIVKGRHDPQIISRAVHVVNAVLQFACLDLLLFERKKDELI
jgi:chorismate synthase